MRINRLAAAALMLMFGAVLPAQTEWFDGRKAAYRTGGGKWIKGIIGIAPDSIEVYNRKDMNLVIRFTDAEVESGLWKRRRILEACRAAAFGYGVFFAQAQQAGGYKRGSIVVIPAIAGIALAVALSKAKYPWARITDGQHSIEVRVDKDNGKPSEVLRERVLA